MSITVKQLSDKFSYLTFKDFQYLTGKSSNIKGDDTVSLPKLAGLNKKDIQIFATKKEEDRFLTLLKGSRQTEVAKSANIDLSKNKDKNINPFSFNNGAEKNNALGAYIPPEQKNWIA